MQEITDQSTIAELLERYPGARRALFRNYHIGGCSSCGFQPEETLEHLCRRNDNLSPQEVLETIKKSHEEDEAMLVSPKEASKWLSGEEDRNVLWLDIRSQQEHEAVRIENSKLLTQDLMRELKNKEQTYDTIVLYDHQGHHSLDAASFLAGHDIPNVRCLRGGIDAWALEVDTKMPRYELQR